MAEGLLPPVIARLVADASEYSAGMAKAVGATRDWQAEMDRADLASRKMAVSAAASADKAAASQSKLAAASAEATAATEELAAVQKSLADGEITAAEAATRQAAAEERLVAANEAAARAALQVERASIAQAEAQLGAGRAATENAAANEAAATRATGAWGRFNGVLGQIKTLGALAIGAVAVESVKMASEFNKQMELVHTQAGAAQSEVDQLKNKVLALAPAVGFGPEKLAEALYHIESVGYRGADAMQILKTAADGAQVGNASLDDTTYALTSTMKSFEMEGVGGATQAMGALNAIVGQGDMRMQDLNKAIGTGLMSTAQTFGVSIESVGAALAFLTDRGEHADVAATRLTMGMTLMANPSAKATKLLMQLGVSQADATAGSTALADGLVKAGLSTNDMAADMHKPDGIFVALKDLVDHMTASGVSAQEQAEIIAKVFGGARTGKAIMALVANLDGVKGKYDAIITAENNLGESITKTHQTAAFQWKAFAADLQVIAVKIGDFLTPVLTKVLELVRFLGRTVADTVGAFAPLGSGIAHVFEGLAGPIGSLVGSFGHLVGSIAGNATAVRALAAAYVALNFDAIVAGASALIAKIGGPLIDVLGRAYFAVYNLGQSLRTLGAGSMTAGVVAAGALSLAFVNLVQQLQGVANASKEAHTQVKAMTDQQDTSSIASINNTTAALLKQKNELKSGGSVWKLQGEVLTGNVKAVADYKSKLEATNSALDANNKMTQNHLTNLAALGLKYHLTNDQIETMARGLVDLNGPEDQTVAAFGRIAQALGGNQKAMADFANTTKGATQDVLGFDGAITGLINAHLGLHGALLTMNADMLALKKSIDPTNKALDDTTAAGIANSQAIDKLIGDYSQYADQLGKSNIPAEQQIPLLQQQYDKLINAGVAAGISRQRMIDYANSLGLVRPVVSTQIETPGMPQALQDLAHLDGSISKVDGRVIHIYSVVDQADPNVVGPGTTRRLPPRHADGAVVDYYAVGGLREDHVAQIAPAGANRMWAEPETGGEAYIPLGMAKRARSLDILAEVMRRFGISAQEALKMIGASGVPTAAFASGGRTVGGDGASGTGTAATTLAGGYGKLSADGGDLNRKTQDLTKRLVEQTKALKDQSTAVIAQTKVFKDQNAVVDDGHTKLGSFTDAVGVHHAAVDALIPRVQASTGVHLTDHKTVDGLTGGYHTLTGAIQQTPTAHHTNTDAPGATTSTQQIRTLEATIRAMQPKTDHIDINTSVSGVFASLFARGGLVQALAGGGMLRGPGTGTSDSILGVDAYGMPTARVSNGEFVVNARDTARTLPLLQAINAGVFASGGLIQKLAAGGAVATRVSDPTVTNAARYDSGAAALVNRVDAMLHPKAQTLIEHRAADEVKKKIAAMSAGVGGGVARWAPLVLAVDKMLGLSPSLLGVELSQMQTESGGNPAAINLTDSNAAAGHPSQGLMQVIPGTFAAYAGPFRGRGILDPLANIYAGLNYAMHRYGPGLSALGHGHGYARGGLVGMASGGIMEDDPRWNGYTMGNRRVGPGYVLPATAIGYRAPSGGGSVPEDSPWFNPWTMGNRNPGVYGQDFYNLAVAQIYRSAVDMRQLGFGGTSNADIRRAQAALGVRVDGIIGPQTFGALEAAARRGGAGAAGPPPDPRLVKLLSAFHHNELSLQGGDKWNTMLGDFSHLNKGNAWVYDKWADQTAALSKQYAAQLKAYQPTYLAHRGQVGYENLERVMQDEATHAAQLAATAADLQGQARARLGGPEATLPVQRPTSLASSWFGLHAPTPTHANVVTVVKLDSKVLFTSMQTQSLRNEQRNGTNNLSKSR